MISAYRIGAKVWMVNTARVAEPRTPRTLPIGSAILTLPEAKLLRDQLSEAIAKTSTVGSTPPRVKV